MPNAAIDDGSFIRLVNELGVRGAAKRLKIDARAVQRRRRRLELNKRINIIVPKEVQKHSTFPTQTLYPGRVHYEVKNGIALFGGDCHYWPGPPTLMHRAFVKFCRELKPKLVGLNGDLVDMAKVSRHPPLGWDHQPSVQEEIEAGQERLSEIEMACGRGVPKIWPVGNHDERFETRLAVVAPEYSRVRGTRLKDHFPNWVPCHTLHINNDVAVFHNWKGGKHAAHNNTVESGMSTFTNHLHSAKVSPFTPYGGEGLTRYGVDTGLIADPYGEQFMYARDRPRDWRSAFAVATFSGGRMMLPELVLKWDDNHVQFRGKLIRVQS